VDLLLFSANVMFADYGTDAPVEPLPHERVSVGYWDGGEFVYSGSNHAVFEFGDKPGDPQLPTHWMPLPEPPA
jgi:hypothetical protein